MLPRETYSRLLTESQILGLKLALEKTEQRIFYFRVDTLEGPNDLLQHSIGAAAAQAAAGTGWNTITIGGNRQLEPENENVAYHLFFGVNPGQAWIYRRYPTGRDINSLYGTRAIGDAVGFIDGIKSPYQSPSPISEMFVIKGIYPEFLGYHPYLEPSSITVRLAFYVTRYDVSFMGVDPSGKPEDTRRKVAAPDIRERAKVRTVGGRDLVRVPTWLLKEMSR